MQDLFTTCSFGPFQLKNSVTFLPFFTAYADEKGHATPTLLRHYQRMAASGVGLVVVEAAGLRHSTGPHTLHAFDVKYLPGLTQLAATIKEEGAKAVLQICHPGRFSFTPDAQAPSAVAPFGNPKFTSKAMDENDMDKVVADFVEATDIAMRAGFDGVELHGGTGYLLASFLSPHTNRRTDDYGGSLENRVRFPGRVCRAVRHHAADFPIGYRFMVREYIEGGLELTDGVNAAKLLCKQLHPAYLSVTAGMYECWALLAQRKEKSPEGYMLPEARAVKTALPEIPVIAAGQLGTRKVCEQALADDLTVGLGRVLFADDNWLRKISGGMHEDVRSCIQCNVCQKQVSSGKPVFCSRWSKKETESRLEGLPEDRLRRDPLTADEE